MTAVVASTFDVVATVTPETTFPLVMIHNIHTHTCRWSDMPRKAVVT